MAPFGERRVEDPIAELFEQRTQQQKGVAVLTTDVLAVHEHARIRAERVANAEHHGFEKRVALLVEGQAGLDVRQRVIADGASASCAKRHSGSSTSIRTRGGSSLKTPTPASAGSGHGASITARACFGDERVGLGLEFRRARGGVMTRSASSRAA